MLDYPKRFTDPEWKKLEKTIKVSNTGVGQTLRDVEKAHQRLDAGVQAIAKGTAKADNVKPALAATMAAAKKAQDKIEGAFQKSNDQTATRALRKYSNDFNGYRQELAALNLADHRGIKTPVDTFNKRLK